jgi:hypothetical protein
VKKEKEKRKNEQYKETMKKDVKGLASLDIFFSIDSILVKFFFFFNLLLGILFQIEF